jgi:hypothetical protein
MTSDRIVELLTRDSLPAPTTTQRGALNVQFPATPTGYDNTAMTKISHSLLALIAAGHALSEVKLQMHFRGHFTER